MLHYWLSTSVKENTFKKNLLNARSHLIEIAKRMTYHFDYQALQVCSHVTAAATFCLGQCRFKNSVVTIWVLFAPCQPLQCFVALQEFTQSSCEHHISEVFRKYCTQMLSLQEL